MALLFKSNTMHLSEFILLTLKQKSHAALHLGVLVGKRTTTDYLVFLFQIDHFYAEIFCNRQNKSIEEVRMFEGNRLLSPYLDAIKIDDLLD